ncbi:MAG: NAD(P)-binding domain-containing protein [Cellvibrionaceae bacterium]
MFDTLAFEGVGDVHVACDPDSGLKAIIAIHSTKLGPALGGCRFVHYKNEEAALEDACRLAKSMSYKAATAGLASGGGKSVIIKSGKDDRHIDREKLFTAFGRFVDTLQGRYITAVDSGTSPSDMDIIAKQTNFVSSTTNSGDPSPYTAEGVLAGIYAAVEHKFNTHKLEGLHFAIQGLGHVGASLAEKLARAGAQLTVADLDERRCQRLASEFGAKISSAQQIHRSHCDVFVPCALGGIISNTTLPELNCAVVAGSANNQLSEEWLDHSLHTQGILYAPDYVINAGGLIYCTLQRTNTDQTVIDQTIHNIQNTLRDIFKQSEKDNMPPSLIADHFAEVRLYGAPLERHNIPVLNSDNNSNNSLANSIKNNLDNNDQGGRYAIHSR